MFESVEEVAKYIDHTLLRPTTSIGEIETLCKEGKEFGFHSICINPYYVKEASQFLKGSSVKICTVIGFPLGANTLLQKQREGEECLLNGATELDMVLNLGALKSGNWRYVEEELTALRILSKGKAILKVIMETDLITEEELIKGCKIAKEIGVDFVKTSTGFLGQGATVEKVSLMSRVADGKMRVKASGGIRTLAQLESMLEAGASRIGTSSGLKIMAELRKVLGIV